MRRRLPLAGLLLLGACGAPAPPPTPGQRSQAMADATAHLIGSMNPCRVSGRRAYWEEPRQRPLRDCLDLLPQERMRGIWYTGFEESRFVPGAVSAPRVRVVTLRQLRAPDFELIMPRQASETLWRAMPRSARGSLAVRIDFLGRRTRPRPGDSLTTIIVDRVHEMRVLGAVRTWADLPGRPAGYID